MWVQRVCGVSWSNVYHRAAPVLPPYPTPLAAPPLPAPTYTHTQCTYLLTNRLFPYITPVHSISYSPKARKECTIAIFTRKNNKLSSQNNWGQLFPDTSFYRAHQTGQRGPQALMLARSIQRKLHIMLKPGNIIQTIFRLE